MSQDHMHPREVVLHIGVVCVPGGLVEDAGREVALGFGLHGVPAQVGAPEGHAEQRLPVAH